MVRAVLRQLKLVRRCSSESNTLRYVYSIRGTLGDIAIKEREINCIEIEIVPFIINFSGNCTIRINSKCQNVASVSEEFAGFI